MSISTVDPKPPENPNNKFPDALRNLRLDVSCFSFIYGSNAFLNLAVTNGKKHSLQGKRVPIIKGRKQVLMDRLAEHGMFNDNIASVFFALRAIF